jgi:hypothetical protein
MILIDIIGGDEIKGAVVSGEEKARYVPMELELQLVEELPVQKEDISIVANILSTEFVTLLG